MPDLMHLVSSPVALALTLPTCWWSDLVLNVLLIFNPLFVGVYYDDLAGSHVWSWSGGYSIC
jgi:hypothetical protein